MPKKENKAKQDKKLIKQQQKLLKNYIIEVKQKSVCQICGENRWWVLDFHHIKDKILPIPEMARKSVDIDVLKNEIDKCIIVCSNCHRDIHHKLQENNQKNL